MFFFNRHIVKLGGMKMKANVQKITKIGYVKYFDEIIPVTWERETKKSVHRVKRIRMENGMVTVDKRLFDDKMHKDEIIFEPVNPNVFGEIGHVNNF